MNSYQNKSVVITPPSNEAKRKCTEKAVVPFCPLMFVLPVLGFP